MSAARNVASEVVNLVTVRHGETRIVPLDSHLDDWIGGRDFILNEVLVLA
jgi:hypothetical protein